MIFLDFLAPHQLSILLSKKAFVRSCAFVREKQFWQDWTKANIVIDNKVLTESVVGNKAQLYGDLAVDYVSILGIRSDEHSVKTLLSITMFAFVQSCQNCFSLTNAQLLTNAFLDNKILFGTLPPFFLCVFGV
jgi:hypothetical protein